MIEHLIVLQVPRELVECWWRPLIEQGIDVLLQDSLNAPVNAATDACRYRSGTVYSREATVRVSPTAGPASAGAPAFGKHFILLLYGDDCAFQCELNRALASRTERIFQKHGAVRPESNQAADQIY